MKTELNKIISRTEDLNFDIADAMDDLGYAMRGHSVPKCIEEPLKNALAKLAQANFTLGGIRAGLSSALGNIKK